MTPQERELVDELFERLAQLEGAARDPDAERAVVEGLRRAPNATYALVQTALVQDEALKRADARIRALEAQLGSGAAPQGGGGFLDNMRDALLGRRDQPRAGSVPPVRQQPQGQGFPGQGFQGQGFQGQGPQGQGFAGAPAMGGPSPGGGSFLGTAASAAAGVIGGSLLLDGIRSMMAPSHAAPAGLGALDPGLGASATTPWGGGGDLARESGVNDIGNDPGHDPNTGGGSDMFDNNDTDASDPGSDSEPESDFADDSGDFGGGDFGGDDSSNV